MKAKVATKAFDPIKFIFENSYHHAIADTCGITRQAVAQWTEVPWNRVLVVSKITGLPSHKIRPDIYPPPKRTT